MKLLRIEFSFFRQFKKTEIFFPQEGVIGIIGDNGAGKSTLFNAITWALFGKYEEIKNSLLKTQHSPARSQTYVVLDFKYQDNFYRIKRDLVSSPSKNFVQCNGATVASGTTNINDYVRKTLFKMDAKAFKTCFYAAQEDFDSLVKMDNAPRVKMVSKLLDIDAVDIAAEEVRADARRLASEIEAFEAHLKDDKVLEENKTSLTNELKVLVAQLDGAEKHLSTLNEKFSVELKKKEEYDAVYETYQSYSSKIATLETKRQTLAERSLKENLLKLSKLENEHKDLQSIIHQKERYFDLMKRKDELNDEKEKFVSIARLNKQINETNASIQQYQIEMNTAMKKIDSFADIENAAVEREKAIEKIENAVDIARSRAKELDTIIKMNQKALEELHNEIKSFSELGSEVPCPTCKRPLGEHYGQELNHYEEKRNTLVDEIKKHQEEFDSIVQKGVKGKALVDKLKGELRTLNQQLSEKSGYIAKKDSAEREKQKQEEILKQITLQRKQLPESISFNPEEYKALVEEIQKLLPVYEKIIQLQKMVEEIPKVNETIEAIKQEINELATQIKEFMKSRDELKFDKEVHASLIGMLEESRTNINVAKDNKFSLSTKVELTKNSIQQIEKELDEIKHKRESIKDKTTEIVNLNKLDQLYKTYKKDILSKLSPILSEYMSEMIDTMTDGKYDRIELDDQYNVSVYRLGEERPLELFSGAEKKMAAMALRIAISQLLISKSGLASFEMLALDEVFGSMDNKHQDSVMELFKSLKEIFPQIMIVAHNEYVKDMFEHTLEIELNKEWTSSAKWLVNENGNSTWDQEFVENMVLQNYDSSETSTEETEAETTT